MRAIVLAAPMLASSVAVGDDDTALGKLAAEMKPGEWQELKTNGYNKELLTSGRSGIIAYSGALTEAVLLGNVAYRTGEKLEWDAQNLRAKNYSPADKFIRKEYRPGWGVA